MITSVVLFSLLTLTLCHRPQGVQKVIPSGLTCDAFDLIPENPADPVETSIRCDHPISLNGSSIVEALRGAKYVHGDKRGNYTFDDLSSNTTKLDIYTIGDVTIAEKGLDALPKLRMLGLGQQLAQDPQPRLDIVAGAFENLKQLTKLGFNGFAFTTKTIQTISARKNRWDSFWARYCQPVEEILKLTETFAKLRSLTLGCNDTESSPLRKFDRLPKGLKSIDIESCNLGKISSTMFRGMTDLTALFLENDNIAAVERNAFGDLTNLSVLSLSNDSITNLGSDLFKGTTKLRYFDLSGNHIANVSRTNFTDSEEFTLIL